jgi:hypothetical protein
MRRSGRLIVVAIGLALLAGALAVPAVGEGLSPTGDRAMAQLASCAASANNLLVSFVVDESGSLQQTDPTNQRVNGINSAIDALTDLRAGAGGKLDVEANLALFAEGYTPLVPWLSLNKPNAAHLKSVSSAELPNRNRGLYTDYRSALIGAQSSLNAREAKVGGTSCKVILWFTDGGLDVRGDKSSALSDLCLPNGIVDSVRAARISVIALALFHEPSSVTLTQREQLRSVAEGTGAGITCGQTPISSDAVVGAYLRADDASALRRVFAGVGALISGASQSLSLKCPSANCVGGVARFPVDRGIAGFQVIVDSFNNTAQLTLAGPDGKQVRLTAASPASPWGRLKVTERNGLTTARLTFKQVNGPQVGEWTLTSLGPSGKPNPVAVDLYYLWEAHLVVDAPDVVLIGQDSPVRVTVTVAGQKVPPDWYKSMDVKLRVGDTTPLTLLADHNGAFVGSLTLPTGTVPSEVTVTASASAVSGPSGILLAPVSWSAVLPTRLPPTYPTITPTRLVLPTITSGQGTTAILTLHGTKRGSTRACLHGDAKLNGPQAAGNIMVTADGRCVDIGPGTTRNWTFRVVPEALADGRVTGHLQLDLTGEKAGDAVSVSVPVSSSMTRPVDEPLRWALVASFIALSLVVPLALLSIGNWWIGRFRLTELTRVASIPVTVTPAGIEPRRKDSAVFIEADDFHPVGEGTVRKRTFNTQGVKFAHALPWPMSDPNAYATASPGEIVLSGTGEYSNASGCRAPMVTALEQCWVLVVDPVTVTETEAPGLIIFVNEDTGLREIIAARGEKLLGFGGWEVLWAKLFAAAGMATARPVPTALEMATADDAGSPPLDGPPQSTIFDDEAVRPDGSPFTEFTAGTSSPAVPRRSGWSGRKKHNQEAAPPSLPDSQADGSPTQQGTPTRAPEDEFPPPPPLDF